MNRSGRRVELHAQAGKAVLVGPGEVVLPADLEAALDEWACIAETVRRTQRSDPESAALVSDRGRALAARIAGSTGAPVGYADPVAGSMVILSPPAEPTPWATGLIVSAATAVLVGLALFTLSQGLLPIGIWAVLLANLVVAAGLGPSIWLGRRTPVWRWIAYGAAAGIILAWITLTLR